MMPICRRYFSWQTVVGLEVHVQLATQHKLFSDACNEADAPRNSHVAPFDAALPGSMPVLNQSCIELAIRAALLLNSSIHPVSYFDRKHYTFPDLPAGYQITQYHRPFAVGGTVDLGDSVVRIKQIQIEQDSAKTIEGADGELIVDLNRAGVGLIEVVTEPDMRSAEEAVKFTKELTAILTQAGVCGGSLELGNIRFDANVSVTGPKAPNDAPPLGVRVELKNLNSFALLRAAIGIS